MRTLSNPVAIVLLAALAAPAAADSQQPAADTAARERSGGKSAVKLEPWLSLETELDNNVFRLRSSRKRALNDPTAADIASGRFAGMESAADVILQARAGIGFELDGLGGRALALAPSVRYEHYTRNSERSHATVAVALAQAHARGAHTRLAAAYTPSYFPKNYLLDATDADGDARIGPAERRYARAEYAATELELAHRLRLKKSRKRSPLGAELELGAGYYSRAYDEPFAGRDLSGPAFRSTLSVAPGKRLELEAGYDLEMLSSDEAREVLILDEAAAGSDLNGNGTATDTDVRTAQLVDRSRREHKLGFGARLDLTKRADLRLGYGLRLRDYLSELPLDLGHRDRRDTRHELRGELSTRLAKGVRFSAGARFARQTTNRLFDPDQTDEGDDYTRIRGFAGVRMEL